jgi:hypothetical protein
MVVMRDWNVIVIVSRIRIEIGALVCRAVWKVAKVVKALGRVTNQRLLWDWVQVGLLGFGVVLMGTRCWRGDILIPTI